jgi:hypothetical protein
VRLLHNSGNPREIGGQIVGDPVGETLLVWVVRPSGKGQDDDRQARRRLWRVSATAAGLCRLAAACASTDTVGEIRLGRAHHAAVAMRPRCSLIFGSTSSRRYVFRRSSVPRRPLPSAASSPPHQRRGSRRDGVRRAAAWLPQPAIRARPQPLVPKNAAMLTGLARAV